MARPQVAVGGTASNTEGSCEYIKQAVEDSRQRGGTPAWELGEGLTTPCLENVPLLRNIHRQSWITETTLRSYWRLFMETHI
jgi:hypothetical protein